MTINNLRVNDTAEKFRLDLEFGGRFMAGPISGAPVPGIKDMDRGVLPEMYWVAAESAVYAVFSYGTPVLWKTEDGTWYMPNHKYSTTTSKHRNKMVDALKLFGATVEKI